MIPLSVNCPWGPSYAPDNFHCFPNALRETLLLLGDLQLAGLGLMGIEPIMSTVSVQLPELHSGYFQGGKATLDPKVATQLSPRAPCGQHSSMSLSLLLLSVHSSPPPITDSLFSFQPISMLLSLRFCFSVFFFVFFPDRISWCSPAVLELTPQTMLASNSEIFLPLPRQCWD